MKGQLITAVTNDASPSLAWWREARFGMFIHWGMYSLLAGQWGGKPVSNIGEWIKFFGRIPTDQYEKIAKQFNPEGLDVDQWVRLAKRAGMKYLVITAKHHDGFAMYDSSCDAYNIVSATPYGQDPMKALADACRHHRIRLCFYYSQTQDWHHPGGAGHWQRSDDPGNIQSPEAFEDYLQNKVKPQLRELLTQYGPVGLIWFDTPLGITSEQSRDLKLYVNSIQTDCLVCGRIGNEVGDYRCLGDNMIPVARPEGNWETPATINDTWGYKSDDHNWKSVDRLLYLLVDLASKGVNYLLNIGPMANGEVPQPSVERLEAIGDWLKINGEAIYGSQASPYPYEFDWGRITRRRGRLYLHLLKWPMGPLRLEGLRTRIVCARLLGNPDAPVSFHQSCGAEGGQHALEITLPATPPLGPVPVLRLDYQGRLNVDPILRLLSNGQVMLPAMLATVSPSDAVTFARNGSASNWTMAAELSWKLRINHAGRYRVEVATNTAPRKSWVGGQELVVTIGHQQVRNILKQDQDDTSPRTQYQQEVISILGWIELDQPGEYIVQVCPASENHISRLILAGLRLVLEK